MGKARKAGITVGIMLAMIVAVAAAGTVVFSLSGGDDEARRAAEQALARDADILAADIRQYLGEADMRDDERQMHLEMLADCNGMDSIVERATCLEVVASSIMWQP